MAEAKPKKSFSDMFQIDDQESCEKAIKHGGIAAIVLAVVSAAFGVAGFFTSSDNKELAYFMDPWILCDTVLLIVLGIFVFRKSRVAATLFLIYFIIGKIVAWVDLGRINGIFLTLAILVFIVNAMRATYIWHKLYKAPETGDPADPAYVQQQFAKSKKLLWIALFFLVTSIAACIGAMVSVVTAIDETVTTVLFAAAFVYSICALAAIHVILGCAAMLQGRSWVMYGLVPVVITPIGPMISWVLLRIRATNGPAEAGS
jgi:hypothetical protein